MRLTEKNEFGNYIGTNLLDDECLCRALSFDELNEMTTAFNKLGQLADIEDELGIDLITLFKVISQGYIFVEEQNTEEKEIVAEYVEPNFKNHTFDFKEPRKEIGKGRPFSRFGKTWSLTKEELENDIRSIK